MKAKSESGAVLLLFAVVILFGALTLLGATARWVKSHPLQQSSDASRLAQARELILGYGATNRTRPGELPFPDRNGDGNYDGNGDCVSSWGGVTGPHLLGRWPAWLEQGCGPVHRNAFGIELTDASSQRLWYALSRNLIFPAPAINSDLNSGWLTVRARDGSVLGAEVAVVILAPELPISGQSRNATSGPGEFLEQVTLGAVTYANGDGDQDFILGAEEATFRDRLAFVTRSQFFGVVTQRVAGELTRILEAHRNAFGAYPWAGDSSGACRNGVANGGLPEFAGDCSVPPPAPPPWFGANWRKVTRYTLVSPQSLELHFDGCPSITYRLDAGDLTRSGRTC